MSFLKNELYKRERADLLIHDNGKPVTPGTWRKRRAELLEKLYVNSYGRTPAAPEKVRAAVEEESKNAYANKVIQRRVRLSFDTPKGEFSF
nr:hypothetical protein [Clostridia bacterium]